MPHDGSLHVSDRMRLAILRHLINLEVFTLAWVDFKGSRWIWPYMRKFLVGECDISVSQNGSEHPCDEVPVNPKGYWNWT